MERFEIVQGWFVTIDGTSWCVLEGDVLMFSGTGSNPDGARFRAACALRKHFTDLSNRYKLLSEIADDHVNLAADGCEW